MKAGRRKYKQEFNEIEKKLKARGNDSKWSSSSEYKDL